MALSLKLNFAIVRFSHAILGGVKLNGRTTKADGRRAFFSDKKKSGFDMRLYFGDFDSSRIFPFPEIDPQEKQSPQGFLSQVQHFAETSIDPVWIDRHAEITRTVFKELARLGVLRMSVPKENGGLGMSQHAYC